MFRLARNTAVLREKALLHTPGEEPLQQTTEEELLASEEEMPEKEQMPEDLLEEETQAFITPNAKKPVKV